MKIKTISRLEEHYTRDCKTDVVKIHRNLDPKLHPFEKAREYGRALQATKLDKMFAKPFIGALDGHTDGVFCTATSPKNLVQFLSGACDGEVRVWDLSRRACVWKAAAHTGFVRGVAVTPDGRSFLSAGDDGLVKRWDLAIASDLEERPRPTAQWTGKMGFRALDHHWGDATFATASDAVELWDAERAEPTHAFRWGADAVNSVRFNPAERCLLASTGSDRGAALYDARAAAPLRKVFLRMRSNGVAWNPRVPAQFALACEDHCAYTFDVRRLGAALVVHKDHVGAVMAVAFSPTGRELATAGYDRTLRIFGARDGRSREVYHTQRMQRAFCVAYSADARYVLSGSDDTCVRIWKARASERLGAIVPREARRLRYLDTLKRRYADMPDVRRIAKHRHVPRAVRGAARAEGVQRDKAKRKADNVRRHAKDGGDAPVPERRRRVIAEQT
ncbi:WD40-repeat-containing domain protein [Tribonema minus]|uniref:WD40-repeat-containing domain protein n=1 Tax=Tribonema minus TaxID=303371 RepID=A0A836C9W7_9STRA|nr:WD40-repeat-containing domain protein [Tribonema minus]